MIKINQLSKNPGSYLAGNYLTDLTYLHTIVLTWHDRPEVYTPCAQAFFDRHGVAMPPAETLLNSLLQSAARDRRLTAQDRSKANLLLRAQSWQ